MGKIRFLILFIAVILVQSNGLSCTIFCAKDHQGRVWAGNNEDSHFSLGNKIGVVSKTDSTLGFIWFYYTHNGYSQGGLNEAGLFYDINSVDPSEIKDADKKVLFPGVVGQDFYWHLLANCKTVPQVIELYSKYKMPWTKTAQMNVADKHGNMGIVTADSAWLVTGNYSISTNYNLCHDDDKYKTCWRYPIAERILKTDEPNFATFTKICEATSQRNIINTIFSNISNLNTGEIWFYYAWDYENAYKTSIESLLEIGDTVLMMRDWFPDRTLVKAYHSYLEYDFKTALGVLNEIDDPIKREDMLKLLAIDMLAGSSKDRATNTLVSEIIEASNHEELLAWLGRKASLKENRNLAKKKVESIKNAGINEAIIWFIIAGGILGSIILIRKKVKAANKA